MYTVQKYKLSYVREPDHAITREKRRIARKDDAAEFCKKYLFDLPVEKLVVLALDNRNAVMGFTEIEGEVAQCAVYPTAVFRFLLSAGARSFIVAHNHPGGGENPSEADWNMTDKLTKAGALLELPCLDHLIISEDRVISLKEMSRWPTV